MIVHRQLLGWALCPATEANTPPFFFVSKTKNTVALAKELCTSQCHVSIAQCMLVP